MPTKNKLTLKQQRAEQVNQAIRIIADHGRRFFYSHAVNRYANMEVDQRGKVWFIDSYSGKRIFTHETVWGGKWRGFSNGGTLRQLVENFRDYIRTGEPMNPFYLGLRRGGHEGCSRAGRRPSRVPPARAGSNMTGRSAYGSGR
jgi:hypothetical protein